MIRPHWKVIYAEAIRRLALKNPTCPSSTEDLAELCILVEREEWEPVVEPNLRRAREILAAEMPDFIEDILTGLWDDKPIMRGILLGLGRGWTSPVRPL